jgi:glycosyltransferase involved in cell wall biosynthesis
VTDSFRSHLIDRGASPENIAVIKNGVDLNLFDPVQTSGTFAAEHGIEGKFVAAYVGTHGMAHGLDTILRAADKLRNREDIVFLLVGEGADRDRIERLRTAMDLQNVLMLGQQPRERMPDVWGAVSVSLVLLRDQELFRSVIPSKIAEGMAMQIPVILGVRGESRGIVEASASGLCITPESADELAEAVRTLADDQDRSASMGAAGRSFAEQDFDRRKLAGDYEALLEGLLGPQRG